MFARLNPATARGRSGSGWVPCLPGLGAGVALAASEPQFLTPISVAAGHNGKSVTRLYSPSKSPDNSSHSSSDPATERYRHQRLTHEKLT